jgi:hypothetical protein
MPSEQLNWVHNSIGSWSAHVKLGCIAQIFVEIYRHDNNRYRMIISVGGNIILYEDTFSSLMKAKHCAPGLLSDCIDDIIKKCTEIQDSL